MAFALHVTLTMGPKFHISDHFGSCARPFADPHTDQQPIVLGVREGYGHLRSATAAVLGGSRSARL
jgi:hypothetical protein